MEAKLNTRNSRIYINVFDNNVIRYQKINQEDDESLYSEESAPLAELYSNVDVGIPLSVLNSLGVRGGRHFPFYS